MMDFVTFWEDLTLDWSPDLSKTNVPLCSEKPIGRYLKTWPTYASRKKIVCLSVVRRHRHSGGKLSIVRAPLLIAASR